MKRTFNVTENICQKGKILQDFKTNIFAKVDYQIYRYEKSNYEEPYCC